MDDLLNMRKLARRIGQTEVGERSMIAASSFPTGVSAGFMVFRIDIGLLCYYDGTRWLTVHDYAIPVCFYLTQATATTQFLSAVNVRSDWAPYVVRVAISTNVLTTNNGTNYWTISLVGYNETFTTGSTIDTFNTSAMTATTWTRSERAPNTTGVPANYNHISLDVTKTLAPGNLQIIATVITKLIIT